MATDLIKEEEQISTKDCSEEVSDFKELCRFVKLSTPNTLVMFLMYLQMTLTINFAAKQLGTEEMASISLSALTANLSGLAFIYGLLSAVDTLAPQSFGAGNLQEVGFLVQRGLICILSTFSLTFLILFNAEAILLGVGQPEIESHLAGVFLKYYFFTIPALAIWECSRRFLWSQDVSQWPFVLIAAIVLIIHFCALKILLPIFGFHGAPISHLVTSWCMCLGVLIWLKTCHPHHPLTWEWNVKQVFHRDSLKEFLRLGIPGIFSMSEWMFFEFFIFLSGTLGKTSLAANSIAYTIIPLVYTIPFGLSTAATARIGYLLAQDNVKSAKKLTQLILILTIIFALLAVLLVEMLRDQLINMFSSSVPVQELTKQIWNYVCLL